MRVVSETSGTCLISDIDLRRDPAQGQMVVAPGVEGEREDRARRRSSAALTSGGDAPGGMRSALVCSFWLSLTSERSTSSPTRKRTTIRDAPGLAGGVDVLDAGDLPQQPLQRRRDAALDLRGARAGHGDQHVDHRHPDLRLLLARQDDDGEQAEQDRADDQERRQPGVDEGASEDSRQAEPRGAPHRSSSTRSPSTRSARSGERPPSPHPRVRRRSPAVRCAPGRCEPDATWQFPLPPRTPARAGRAGGPPPLGTATVTDEPVSSNNRPKRPERSPEMRGRSSLTSWVRVASSEAGSISAIRPSISWSSPSRRTGQRVDRWSVPPRRPAEPGPRIGAPRELPGPGAADPAWPCPRH